MRILVIEDNGPLRLAIAQKLSEEGYSVDHTADGQEGSWFIQENEYALGILDMMLPNRSGRDLVSDFRRRDTDTSILIVTAKSSVEDCVAGLDAGADDYLVKPFALAELMARVRALVRRPSRVRSAVIQVQDLHINLAKREAWRGERELILTSKEFALLELLGLRRGEVVSRGDIWEQLYDFNQEIGSNVIDVFVARLRKKVDQPGLCPLIHTKRGQGYLLAGVE